MWNGYYANIQDSWTTPLLWAPRWFDANGYGTLTDYITPPDYRSSVVSAYVASSFLQLSSVAIPATSGVNILQRFFEVFVNEKEYLFPALTSTSFSRQFFFDISEPQFGWVLESQTPAIEIAVNTSSGSAVITRANSDLDLFYSGQWRWKQENTCILIYGLDIQDLVDTKDSNNWHFVDGNNLTIPTTSIISIGADRFNSMLYMEHPVTKNWSPLHPGKLRVDAFTGFNYDGTIRFRSNSSREARILEEVLVYVDGKSVLARRVQLFNSVDEKGLYFNLSRRYGETNEEFAETLIRAAWFRGQTYRKLRSSLSAALRVGELTTVSASASSFSIPASATGYQVRNIDPWIYTTEQLNNPVSGSTTLFRTIFASGDISCGYVRQLKTDFTSSSGIITFDTYIDNTIDRPTIDWKIPFFTETGSTVLITENFPHEVPDLILFLPSKVDVIRPSTQILRKSFNKTSPCFKWRRFSVENQEIITGLANFDF